MKTQRIILTVALAITSLFPIQVNSQLSLVDLSGNEFQTDNTGPSFDPVQYGKGIIIGMGERGKDLFDHPGQAAALTAMGIAAIAASQFTPQGFATTATCIFCALGTTESVRRIYAAYNNAPEGQGSEASGIETGRIIVDWALAYHGSRRAMQALASFRPVTPLTYNFKIKNYAAAVNLNPDGEHYFGAAWLSNNDLLYSKYGLNQAAGFRHLGTYSVPTGVSSELPAFYNYPQRVMVTPTSSLMLGAGIWRGTNMHVSSMPSTAHTGATGIPDYQPQFRTFSPEELAKFQHLDILDAEGRVKAYEETLKKFNRNLPKPDSNLNNYRHYLRDEESRKLFAKAPINGNNQNFADKVYSTLDPNGVINLLGNRDMIRELILKNRFNLDAVSSVLFEHLNDKMFLRNPENPLKKVLANGWNVEDSQITSGAYAELLAYQTFKQSGWELVDPWSLGKKYGNPFNPDQLPNT